MIVGYYKSINPPRLRASAGYYNGFGLLPVLLFAFMLLPFTAVSAPAPDQASLLSLTASVNQKKDSLFLIFRCDKEPGLTPHFSIEDPKTVVVELHDTRIKKPFTDPGSFPVVAGIVLTEENVGEGRWLTKVQMWLEDNVDYRFSREEELIILAFPVTEEQVEKFAVPGKLAAGLEPELQSFTMEPLQDGVIVVLNFTSLPARMLSYHMINPDRVVYEFSNTFAVAAGSTLVDVPLIKNVVVEQGEDPEDPFTRFIIQTDGKAHFKDIGVEERLVITLKPWKLAAVTPSKKDKLTPPGPPGKKEEKKDGKKSSKKKWIYISVGALAVTTGFASLVFGEMLKPKKEKPAVEEEGPAGGENPPGFPDE